MRPCAPSHLRMRPPGEAAGNAHQSDSCRHVTSTFVAATDVSELKRSVRPEKRLIYIETPANPNLDLADIAAIAAIAHAAGIPLVVDNTFASSHLQRPLELGADVVLHSMTKSLNGHSDVVAGAVIVERAQANAIEIAQWLETHPEVAWVRYPGLPSHPQYELARQQMSGPGSVIAFELRGGVDAGRILMTTSA